MGDFYQRKAERITYYKNFVEGWKLIICGACSGSGYYDYSRGGRTPKCAYCEGKGKVRVSPEEYQRHMEWEQQETRSNHAARRRTTRTALQTSPLDIDKNNLGVL